MQQTVFKQLNGWLMDSNDSLLPSEFCELNESDYSEVIEYLEEHKMLVAFYKKIEKNRIPCELASFVDIVASEVNTVMTIIFNITQKCTLNCSLAHLKRMYTLSMVLR